MAAHCPVGKSVFPGLLEKSGVRISYNIIFMDIQMPVLDGIKTTAIIREKEDKSHAVPIIALTAHAMKGTREKFIEEGMNDYLFKPVRKGDLCAVLRKYYS